MSTRILPTFDDHVAINDHFPKLPTLTMYMPIIHVQYDARTWHYFELHVLDGSDTGQPWLVIWKTPGVTRLMDTTHVAIGSGSTLDDAAKLSFRNMYALYSIYPLALLPSNEDEIVYVDSRESERRLTCIRTQPIESFGFEAIFVELVPGSTLVQTAPGRSITMGYGATAAAAKADARTRMFANMVGHLDPETNP